MKAKPRIKPKKSRSQTGRMARNKGAKGELEVAELLRSHGFDSAHRGRQFSGSPDSPDVQGLPGWRIEVKRAEAISAYEALDQAEEEKGAEECSLVFHRKNNRPWLAILHADDFLKMLRRLEDAEREETEGSNGLEDR